MSKFPSPLRYPGGKYKIYPFIRDLCVENCVKNYIEPYAGGASVALGLLLNGIVDKIVINDLDRAIYAFWWSVKNKPDELCEMIYNTPIGLEQWKEAKKAYSNKDNVDNLLVIGFSVLFLNRTNYSGVIDGGVIGGLQQNGKYKIDCRFNKKAIIARIKRIANYVDNMEVYNNDAMDLIGKLEINESTLLYFDPPYFEKGKSLYMNAYSHDEHELISRRIRSIRRAKWVVSYDDVPEINKLYDNGAHYKLRHSARRSKKGGECIFFSDNLRWRSVFDDYLNSCNY